MEKINVSEGVADTLHTWIYYKDIGAGMPVLMLHGNSETHMVFDYYEKKLSQEYRIILMDSRAHGRSRIKPEYAGKEFTTTDMAKDVAALLDTLSISSCILFGFSDGANIALEFASLFPSRAKAVISVSGNLFPDGLIFPLRLFCNVKYDFLTMISGMFSKILHRTSQRLPVLHQIYRHLTHYRQLTSLLCNSPMLTKERLESITAPVLLIAGTRDLVKSSHSRLMAEWIPHARLVLVKKGTHRSVFGHEDFYLEIIKEFLTEIQRRVIWINTEKPMNEK